MVGAVGIVVVCCFYLSNEKNPGCLGYIGGYTIQLYNIGIIIVRLGLAYVLAP